MSYFVILFSFGYVITLLCLAMPALRYRPLMITRKTSPLNQQAFSIIVVYRNEINNLPSLLASLKAQFYDWDFIELIFVNDASTDGSPAIIEQFSAYNPSIDIKLLDRIPNSNSAKKDGITQAVDISKYDHILLTDADCILPTKWISAFNNHYKNYADALLVAAPVNLYGHGFIAALQQLEMMALQTITAGAFALRQPFMCNGANLSFRKDAFIEVNGYLGNDHLSSGDDIFLLEKLAAEDVLQCQYLKNADAMVQSASKTGWKELIQQRARWARKGKETKSLLNKLVAFQVGAMSLIFILSPLFWWLELVSFKLLISIYLLKFFTDFVVLVIGNQFLEMKKWSGYFFPNFFVYPFIVVAIGLKGLQKLDWHDRIIDRNEHL
ncbi:glycosyltransferase [Nonlabens antarcticus]|uniref:glycosyltransferase n=1 Tax=Nonlabens antarcticus TaxID=392714 RepID=UPI001891F0A7|nr:glycosyltransferase [Nonlabens antarcticus]